MKRKQLVEYLFTVAAASEAKSDNENLNSLLNKYMLLILNANE